jgi:uncharacterized membrane protein
MSMMKMLMGASLMIGAPALAQEPATGVSDAGKQTIQQSFKQRDADLAPLRQKREALQKQFNALTTPEGYDEEKLAAVMAEMRTVEGEIVERTGATLLSLLKTLPAEDRNAFLATLKQPAPVPAPRRRATGAVGR